MQRLRSSVSRIQQLRLGRPVGILCLLGFLSAAGGAEVTGPPTWESLDQRPVAQWWRDAKFGVYMHWTLASVPAWGTHSSFYWPSLPCWPARGITLKDVPASAETVVTMLGLAGRLNWHAVGPDLVVEPPKVAADELPCAHASVLKVTRVNHGRAL